MQIKIACSKKTAFSPNGILLSFECHSSHPPLRYISMARGAAAPPKLPALASQLLLGAANAQRNPTQKIYSKNKQAISLPMLKLLENSIGRRENWSIYEKCLRFTVALLAWWGSFRLGELLSPETAKFHGTTALLASDVKFHEGSISVWLRNPKVLQEDTGDIVEVWSVPEIPDLDPVTALRKFLELRQSKFGEAQDYPLFLHENGRIFTKRQMNADLGELLAIYPKLNNPLDKWTGHSFRAGISTLLASLGFKV